MKTVPTKKTSLFSYCYPLCIMIGLSATLPAHAGVASSGTNHDNRYLILVTKSQNNKKHNVRLYNRDGQEQLLCSVTGPEGKHYQLYVFDMEGRLMIQAKMLSRETKTLNRIPKGNYFFEVLSQDEQVESGQLTVK